MLQCAPFLSKCVYREDKTMKTSNATNLKFILCVLLWGGDF